jgi:hypothetical protein
VITVRQEWILPRLDIVDSRSEVVYSINKAAISAGNNLTINATTIINGYNTAKVIDFLRGGDSNIIAC